VLQTGRDLNLPLMGSAQVTTLMDALLAQGKGDLDDSVLFALYQALMGQVEVDNGSC
jgi:2-hydroxy-3-oxopropionate reductase